MCLTGSICFPGGTSVRVRLTGRCSEMQLDWPVRLCSSDSSGRSRLMRESNSSGGSGQRALVPRGLQSCSGGQARSGQAGKSFRLELVTPHGSDRERESSRG